MWKYWKQFCAFVLQMGLSIWTSIETALRWQAFDTIADHGDGDGFDRERTDFSIHFSIQLLQAMMAVAIVAALS
eukprot:gene17290-755_t